MLIAIAPESVQVEIRLTPGVEMAGTFLAKIDRDRNGALSEAETRAYATSLWRDIRLKCDGRRLHLEPVQWDPAPLADLRAGLGVMRFRARAPVEALKIGEHHIDVSNRHRTSESVFLVNALVPEDPRVVIQSQKRNERQTRARIAFAVGASSPSDLESSRQIPCVAPMQYRNSWRDSPFLATRR